MTNTHIFAKNIVRIITLYKIKICTLIRFLKCNFVESSYIRYRAKLKIHTFRIQIANTILSQCISHCLYKIGHTPKAITCLKLKVICHAYQADNSYSENKQFISKN